MRTPLDQETTGACPTCGARELRGICVQGCPKCAHCGTPIAGADYETLFRAPHDMRVVTVCYTCYDANPDAATVFDMVRVR